MSLGARSLVPRGECHDHAGGLAVVDVHVPTRVAILVTREPGVDAPRILDDVGYVVDRARVSVRVGEPLERLDHIVVELVTGRLIDRVAGDPVGAERDADRIPGRFTQTGHRPHDVRPVTVIVDRKLGPSVHVVEPRLRPVDIR